MTTTFAAFAIATRAVNGKLLVAAVVRPDGSVGLPGGELAPSDRGYGSLAARREAVAAGWQLGYPDPFPVHEAIVAGKAVEWYFFPCGTSAQLLPEYKEKGRITPLWIPLEELLGFGNEEIHALIRSLK